MARFASSKQPARYTYSKNPETGTIMSAPAGGQATVEIEIRNDDISPASYRLEVDGLPVNWFEGAGEKFEEVLAVGATKSFVLTLKPPVKAEPGEYDFRVRVVSAGEVMPPGNRALKLMVDPGAQSDVPDEAVVTQIEPEPPTEKPPRIKSQPTGQQRTPKAPVRREEAPVRTEELPVQPQDSTPTPSPSEFAAQADEPDTPPVIETPRPQPVRQTVTPPPPPEPEPSDEPEEAEEDVRPAATQMPTREEPPRQREGSPQQPEPPRYEAPRWQDAAPVDIDEETYPPIDQEEEEEEPEEITEPSLLDPSDGTVITLRPGETRLLRFSFTNDSARDRMYVMEMDDSALEYSWFTTVREQVHLGKGGVGELSLRLNPPKNAAPDEYPFSVTVGPLDSVQRTTRNLTLCVMATPAVKLTAKQDKITVGPLARSADFQLSVESQGNADTAFRIAVQAPETADDTEKGKSSPDDPIYVTPQWRYLFDKEMETLRKPSAGRPPHPISLRLRLQRQGIWWLGFKETHQAKVAAVPVTEPNNGGKDGNSVDVAITRWRIFPLPAFIMVPLLVMLLVLLSGGAHDINVSPYTAIAPNGEYWIAAKPAEGSTGVNTKISTDVSWKAGPFALLQLSVKDGEKEVAHQNIGGSGHYPSSVEVLDRSKPLVYTYNFAPIIGSSGQVTVHFVATHNQTPFGLIGVKNQQQTTQGMEGWVDVPKNGSANFGFQNLAHGNNDISYWFIQQPDWDSGSFKRNRELHDGKINQSQSELYRISANNAAKVDDEETITMITTDAHNPMVTIHLKVVADQNTP